MCVRVSVHEEKWGSPDLGKETIVVVTLRHVVVHGVYLAGGSRTTATVVVGGLMDAGGGDVGVSANHRRLVVSMWGERLANKLSGIFALELVQDDRSSVTRKNSESTLTPWTMWG